METFDKNLQLAQGFKKELTAYCQLHHPNIIPVSGVVMSNDMAIRIAMELFQGSLTDLIKVASDSKGEPSYLSFREKIDIATDTTAAVMYMHRVRPQFYVHGNIRSANVMITSNMAAKVVALGASHMFNSIASLSALDANYCAPERVGGSDGGSAYSTREADVYSLGVTLTELFTGLQPISSERQCQIERVEHHGLQDLCFKMT
ncbi:uncharacterized protein LOC134183768 [Corticium candelabrum]|uniref:uncharacterized protein LOC134183768 n=1 Tax=Corticium candelabrum TaxID=121492 RepID=UPI002E26A2D7|nr:uncharacterized protein LOC134183768 [Corticium candelabrum]